MCRNAGGRAGLCSPSFNPWIPAEGQGDLGKHSVRAAGPQDRGSQPRFEGVLPGPPRVGPTRLQAWGPECDWVVVAQRWRVGAGSGTGGQRRGEPPGHSAPSGGHGEAAVSPGALSPPRLSGPAQGPVWPGEAKGEAKRPT